MNNDQAENLRKLVENESKCKSLFFMSGKEKVGQTVLITNLATFLSENDYKTLIIDSGSGFFRTDVLLNVFSKYGSVKAIENSESLDDLMVSINDNLEIIYMRPVFEKVKTSKELLTSLEGYLDDFKEKYDFILIDLEDSDIESIKVLFDYRTKLVFTLDSGDLEELKTTYCIIKDIENNTDIEEVNIIVNKVKNKSLADDIFERLKLACDKFLGIEVRNLGYVSDEDKVVESLKEQSPVIDLYKDSEIYDEFKEIFSQIILD